MECSWHNGVVKSATAVRRLGSVAESLSSVASYDEALITDAYVFGDILNGPESLDVVSVAFVVDLPVLEVSWCARPARDEAFGSVSAVGQGPGGTVVAPRRLAGRGSPTARYTVRAVRGANPTITVFPLLRTIRNV